MFSHAKLTATMLGCYGWLLRCLEWILGVPYSTCICEIFNCFIIKQMKSSLTAHLDSQHLIVKIIKRPVILSLQMYIVFCIHIIVLINDETTIINSNNNSLCFVYNISSTYYIYILSRNSLLTCKGPKINFRTENCPPCWTACPAVFTVWWFGNAEEMKANTSCSLSESQMFCALAACKKKLKRSKRKEKKFKLQMSFQSSSRRSSPPSASGSRCL